jgi:hypothetical protein
MSMLLYKPLLLVMLLLVYSLVSCVRHVAAGTLHMRI